MRVSVDRERCQGHNRCSMTCPEVYKIDEQGYAHVELTRVPVELEARARVGGDLPRRRGRDR